MICFGISFTASVAGAVCGLGGGIVIKPFLDATGVVGIAQASLLSGCTVLAMSLISLCRRIHNGTATLDLGRTLPLSLGAIAGGFLGKSLFEQACLFYGDAWAGIMQNGLLMAMTLLTLGYLVYEDRIRGLHLTRAPACLAVGLLLGCVSSLLGIGGGPINLMVLGLFFGMGTRTAGLNSLFVIALSQASGLAQTCFSGSEGEIDLLLLLFMTAGGVLGGLTGGRLDRHLSEMQIETLLKVLMVAIAGLCAHNIYALIR